MPAWAWRRSAAWHGSACHFLVGHPFSKTIVLVWNLAAESAICTTLALALRRWAMRFAARGRSPSGSVSRTRRLDREVQAVGRLQRQLLPADVPRAIPGYEWSVHYETSTRAGGGYYDFREAARRSRRGILIADASGHGASAAVLMAMARSLLHEVAAASCRPERVMRRDGAPARDSDADQAGSSPRATSCSSPRAARSTTRSPATNRRGCCARRAVRSSGFPTAADRCSGRTPIWATPRGRARLEPGGLLFLSTDRPIRGAGR